MIQIILTPSEMLLGAHGGIMRQVENVKNGKKQRFGATSDSDWQRNIEGALGEMALAKYFNIYWSGKGVMGAGDVDDHEVRTSHYDTARLILHPDDKDNKKYWLVTGINGTYMIRGWILGIRGKQQQYWDDPLNGRPAFFVPQKDLHSL